MKQFAVLAYDYTDNEAINRRLAAREAHLDGIRKLAKSANFISGGAILNEAGKMIGSNAHFQFANRHDFDAWLASEPYMTERVWEKVDVKEIKLFDPAG